MNLSEYKKNPKTTYLASELETFQKQEEEARVLGKDVSMKDLSDEELKEIIPQKEALIKQIESILSVEKEEEEFPNEIILEVRAGAGGEEASLFAEELASMYRKYSEKKGWQWKNVDESPSPLGGTKTQPSKFTEKEFINFYNMKQEYTESREFQRQKKLDEFIPPRLLLSFFL